MVQFALWSFGLYSREVVYSGEKLFSYLIGALIFSAALLLVTCYFFSLSGIEFFGLTNKYYLAALAGFVSIIAVERPEGGIARQVAPMTKFGSTPSTVQNVEPRLGEFTLEILDSAGYSPSEIESLIATGSVA